MKEILLALLPLYIAAAVAIIKEVFKLARRSVRYRSKCCCGSIEFDSPEQSPEADNDHGRKPNSVTEI